MKVLYVDDDSDDREIFAEIVEAIDPNIKVVEAANGIETINLLAAGELPDIIFLDLNMPRKGGIECLKEIRSDARLRDLSIAIYSTSASEEDIEDTFV